MDATQMGNNDCVRALMDNGADVGATDSEGRSALHYAAGRWKSIQIPKFLVAEGSNVNTKDKRNWTPLHHAASVGTLDNIVLFAKSGVNIKAVDTDGNTVLRLLANASCSLSKIFGLLVAKGADVNAVNVNGCTPLHIVAKHGSVEDMENTKALVSNGALVNVKDQNGRTPLHIACAQSVYNRRDIYPERGECAGPRLCTLLKGGLRRVSDFDEFISLLISKGADVNAPNRSGTRPLHSAVGNPACIKLLIAKGADVNAEDNQGYIPLHYARSAIARVV